MFSLSFAEFYPDEICLRVISHLKKIILLKLNWFYKRSRAQGITIDRDIRMYRITSADYRRVRINALPGCTIIISALAIIIVGMAINSCRSGN